MSALGRVIHSGMARHRVQTLVIGLATMLAVTASVLGGALLVSSEAPFEKAFDRQNGAQLTAQFDARRATAAQLADSSWPFGVAATSGPFPTATVTPGFDGYRGAPLSVAGRSTPGGGIDKLTMTRGRWVKSSGEIVLSADTGPEGRLGQKLEFPDLPGSPTLTVVGVARSVSRTADAWVLPSQVAELTPSGKVAGYQMLYRFVHADTAAQMTRDRAAVTAAVPAKSLTGAQSWLGVKKVATRETALFVPFLVAFGVLGLVMSVLIVGNVVAGAVATSQRRIGILKAVGCTPGQVVRACAGQALIPAATGAALGTAAGHLLATPVFSDTADAYGTAGLGIELWIDVAVIGGVLGLATLTACASAWRAGRLRTVDALAVGRTPGAGRGRWKSRHILAASRNRRRTGRTSAAGRGRWTARHTLTANHGHRMAGHTPAVGQGRRAPERAAPGGRDRRRAGRAPAVDQAQQTAARTPAGGRSRWATGRIWTAARGRRTGEETLATSQDRQTQERTPAASRFRSAAGPVVAEDQNQRTDERTPAPGQGRRTPGHTPAAGQGCPARGRTSATDQDPQTPEPTPAANPSRGAPEHVLAAGHDQRADAYTPAAGQDQQPIERTPVTSPGRRAAQLAARLPVSRAVGLGLARPFARPARTVAMVVAVLFGVAAVTFATGLSSSLGEVIASKNHNAADVTVGSAVGPGEPVRQGQSAAADPATVASITAAIAAQPGTRAHYGSATTEATVSGMSGPVTVTAFDGDASWGGFTMVSGRWFTGAGEAVVPSTVLTATGARVGDTVTLTVRGKPVEVRIVGEVFDTGHDGRTVLTDATTLRPAAPDLNSPTQYADLRPGTDAHAYLTALNAELKPLGVTASTTKSSNGSDTVTVLDSLTALLTLMLVCVAGLGVLGGVVLDTHERVHDLGIHKALGMTPRQTVTMVVTSVVLPGLAGGALGVPLGLAVHGAVIPAMGHAAGLRLPHSVIDVYDTQDLILLGLAGVAVAVLGSLLPAGWAARIRTATALRAE